MVRAKDDGTLPRGLQLLNLFDLELVDHDLRVDTFEDADHIIAHKLEGIGLMVGHDDPQGVTRLLVHILIYLVLVDVKLERVLVVG